MKTKQIILAGVLGLCGLFGNGQSLLQATAAGTSGGLGAGITGPGNFIGDNTFYGHIAGDVAGQTYQNTYIGAYSGFSKNSGNYNSCLGFGSGTIIGRDNVCIGISSGSGDNGDNDGNSLPNNFSTYVGSYSGTNGGGNYNVFIGNGSGRGIRESNKLWINTSDAVVNLETPDSNPLIWGDFALDQLKFNAKVGIGFGFGNYPTTSGGVNVSKYNLFVKGGILTEEVRVSLANTWADYVFAKNYNLPKLNDVEAFIAKNGHLQNVPSAKEVKENGIELGEMAKIQQEKIEELTLYIIEQNKINEKQNALIEKLEARLNKLEIK